MYNMVSFQISILWQQNMKICVCNQQKLNDVANAMFWLIFHRSLFAADSEPTNLLDCDLMKLISNFLLYWMDAIKQENTISNAVVRF